MDSPVVVVTGAGGGIGRAITERLVADGHAVVIVDVARPDDEWLASLTGSAATVVVGDAGEESVTARAVDAACALGGLVGWVNNAAVFHDAWLHEAGGSAVAELVRRNLHPCLAGAAAAVNAFRAAGSAGSIVNVSSHQAQRPVRGALPYATAKAAIEGLTRALAVDYGPWGIRTNAVALGSITTERLESLRVSQSEQERRRTDRHMADLHPLGRAGLAAEVADVVAYLVSDRSSFVNGAIVPVDGGRSVQGPDPEARFLP